MDIVEGFGLLVLVAALVLLGLIVRRRVFLARGGGAIDCSYRLRPAGEGRGWTLGVARMTDRELLWFRVFSFSLRPRRRFPRSDLVAVGRRRPTRRESLSLLAGAVVVTCRPNDPVSGLPVELAMGELALTGFLAWLESVPPGAHLRSGA